MLSPLTEGYVPPASLEPDPEMMGTMTRAEPPGETKHERASE